MTATVNGPPSAETAWVCGLIVPEQRCWVTVKVCPAIVIVPVRDMPLPPQLFTSYVTVPFPLPELPLLMSSHPTLATAVHAHPPPAVTPTESPLMPSLPTVIDVGLIEYEHAAAA